MVSSNLKQKLGTCFKNSLPQCNIKKILKSTNLLSSLFCFKDASPKKTQSHIGYTISCVNYNVTYYGKTERHLNYDLLYTAVLDHLLLHNYQRIIQKKSAFGSRTLPCLLIFFWNFMLIWQCQKWSLKRGTLVAATTVYQTKCLCFVLPDAALWF